MTGTVAKRAPRVHGGKGSRQRLAEGEQMLVDHTTNGMRLSDLVEKYGVSAATVSRRLKEALDSRVASTVDEYREQQNAMLDEQMAELTRQLEAGTRLAASATSVDPETGAEVLDVDRLERGLNIRQKAIEARLRLADRRARLNGLDAPVKVEAAVTVETVQERELRDLLDQAQREQQAREQQLVEDEA